MPPVRRLTAILAADVAGYSRLMGADEEGTHERLRAHLGQLVNPKIAEHRGRIVKNTGDGFLAEFASVVDAVRCAMEVQRGMIDREPEVPEERRIKFRIGVNLGDVIAEEEDIFGDGVNVAARLEALAEPGGICISRVVRDQIRDKLPYPFEDKGEQSVKNLARPVRVYALRTQGVADPRASNPPIVPRGRTTALAAIAAAFAAVLVFAAIAWWVWPATKPSTSPAVAVATSIAPPLAAPRLSIVVLPFVNLSNDPDQQYFADGITEDLTTDLSRLPGMFVISRNTAFTYRNKPVDTKQIGRELGVHYVLEGSVQRSGSQVRVNTQLIDAATDRHLWAERFDRDMGDLFAVQNEITTQIKLALNLAMISAEATRPTSNPNAQDYIFRGRAALSKPQSRDNFVEAVGLFERALALDPHSAAAQASLAMALTQRVLNDMSDTARADIARAEDLVAEASAGRPAGVFVHYAKGQLLRAQGRCEEAIPEYEAVLAIDRNATNALTGLSGCKLVTGLIEEVIPLQEQAIRLSPHDPAVGFWDGRIGFVHLLQSRTDEAIVWLEKARSGQPDYFAIHSWLASAYGLKGETERAAAELAKARRLRGEGSFSSIATMKVGGQWGPKSRALLEATYFAGLRKAGVPEE
jgi:adenylate cyclase